METFQQAQNPTGWPLIFTRQIQGVFPRHIIKKLRLDSRHNGKYDNLKIT